MNLRTLISLLILGLFWVMTSCSNGTEADSPGHDPGPGDDDPIEDNVEWDPADFDTVYDVGPGQPLADPSEVPWESLQPSTLVRIYYRETPYRTKWLITTTATREDPVVVLGVPDGNKLPVISGQDATTRSGLYYLNEVRSVVKVGNYTGDHDVDAPAYVYIQNLEIRSARPGYTFNDRNGDLRSYNDNAAAVHIEEGDHITVVGCDLHDCGNGLFSTHLASDVLIRKNHIYDNGNTDSILEHNSYTGSRGITFEFNHYGPLRTGCLGNNLKDRSSGTIIRYNWVEGGNRQLDLVETTHQSIFDDPAYEQTFVYGNILIEPDGAGNSQILHYGGDDPYDTTMYRQGTLFFYHNTVVSTRTSPTTLMRLSTNAVHADVRNNILFADAGDGYMAITSGSGQTFLDHNWLPNGWRETHESHLDPGATLTAVDNVLGTIPGFVDPDNAEFFLGSDSDCLNGGGPLRDETDRHPVDQQYVKHTQSEPRQDDGTPHLGALD